MRDVKTQPCRPHRAALAKQLPSGSRPHRIGRGQEIGIRGLVTLIRDLVGYPGAVNWDTSKPDGQPRRCLDTTRCRNGFQCLPNRQQPAPGHHFGCEQRPRPEACRSAPRP